ncbi:ubiquinol oxidase subunit II [Ramlibacter sp. USB13]|uniref:Ubiquinol oxidase subunit 2 n=2 Tax=Ramlibacter cellulosilyticus TaxID=2764187 RepID=A0A923MN02_9BURK|nr:ubiquinol oxidase subunit II [Ramlibacter cellulosilyticus]
MRIHSRPKRNQRFPQRLVILMSLSSLIVMKPHGDIAVQQAQLIVTSTFLMLLIIVPVIALTLFFAYKYRQSNTKATYTPDWDHSTKLELVIWGVPLLIIIALGAITWISTHKLDPFRPLDRIDAQRPVPAGTQPLVVNVVAMDWKWLFLYPEQGIATVNELALPVDRPVEFRMTASTVMNTFYVPAMAGMVYAMPGMQTKLNAVMNKTGTYEGLSANYSGAGFSDMRFKVLSLTDGDFEAWVANNQKGGEVLGRASYLQLEKPSHKDPVRRYAKVEDGLYEAVLNRCVDGQKMCAHQMMAIDAAGGLGKGNVDGVLRQSTGRGDRSVVAALCTPDNPLGLPRPDAAAAAQ